MAVPNHIPAARADLKKKVAAIAARDEAPGALQTPGNGNGKPTPKDADTAEREARQAVLDEEQVEGAERVGAAEGTASFRDVSNGDGLSEWLQKQQQRARKIALRKLSA